MCPTLAGVLSCALRERGDRQCCLCYSKSIWYFHMRSSYIQISPMEHGGSSSCLTDQRLKGGNDRSSLGSVLIGLSWSFKFCVLKHMPYTRLVPRGLNAELLLFHTQPLCFSKQLPVIRIFFPVAPRPLGERERSAMLWSRLWANGVPYTSILFCTSVGSESVLFFLIFPRVQIPAK